MSPGASMALASLNHRDSGPYAALTGDPLADLPSKESGETSPDGSFRGHYIQESA